MIGIIAGRFDEKSFSSTILNFTLHWDYKHYKESTGQKTNLDRSANFDKIHLKQDCTDGSIVNCVQEPILFSFF